MMPVAMTDEDDRKTTGSRLTEPLCEDLTKVPVHNVAPLTGTLPAAQSGPPPSSVGRATRLATPAFDARYEHKDVLGRGGMGEVQLSLDRRIGREVAMKIVKPGVAHREDLMMRFEREAKIQGRLKHPIVVPVHDLGLRPDGSVYFTMKRVRGLTLEAVIDGLKAATPSVVEHFTLRRVLGALSDLCLGVAFAHSRGVIHRDLKPSNVILGEFGEVHVLDWGIAKVLDADSDVADESVRSLAPLPETPLPAPESLETLVDEIPRTRAGATMGTPGYMSPEQMRGDAVDARSDIYALGCMIFVAREQRLEARQLARTRQQRVRGRTVRDDAPLAIANPQLHGRRHPPVEVQRSLGAEAAARFGGREYLRKLRERHARRSALCVQRHVARTALGGAPVECHDEEHATVGAYGHRRARVSGRIIALLHERSPRVHQTIDALQGHALRPQGQRLVPMHHHSAARRERENPRTAGTCLG
jgi:hypothetical protein